MEAVGIPIIFLLSISLVIYSFRKFAFDDQKLKVISLSVFVFQVLAFIVIGLISKDMPKVIILTDSLIKILVLLLLFISILVGIKSKSLIYTLLPFIMNLTGILNHTTSLNLNNESSLAFTILGILIFIVDTKFRTKEINK
ncbi:putative membrane protein [[Clostridium] sordellii ATCC 9714]|nr:putative membrane protein [[Clostridium] sordellii ATCC 9714] [Paeniclostridium sordellii ATCC 9714]